MTSNGSASLNNSSQKGNLKIPSSLSRDYSESMQKTKSSIHSPHSTKSCSPPLKSSGSTTSTKPSTSPLASQRINSPQNGSTTPKISAVRNESSSPRASF